MRILCAIVAAAVIGGPVVAQGTAFTYQGELHNAGNPAEGPHDLTFSLWDALSGGSQEGSTLVRNNVAVANGRFTVALDFGANALAGDRWLQIGVEGTALSPRQALTASPFSIQTRGIFVDNANNVGIGTEAPLADLHVFGNAAGVRIQDEIDPSSYTLLRDTLPSQFQLLKVVGSGNAFLDIDPILADGTGQGLVRFFRTTDTTGTKRANFYRGDGTTALSAAIGVDGADSFFQTDGGALGVGTAGPTSLLDVAGDARIRNLLGVGIAPSGLAQVSIGDTGAAFGVSVESSNAAFATILATNAGNGPVLWAQGTDDAALGGGGLIVAGFEGGPNIAIDNNEIMARNNGQPTTLHLNADGGPINMGAHDIHPAWAYGSIRSDGTVASSSSNLVSVSHSPGSYILTFNEPITTTDVMVATPMSHLAGEGFFAGWTLTGTLQVGSDVDDFSFSFVVYRP